MMTYEQSSPKQLLRRATNFTRNSLNMSSFPKKLEGTELLQTYENNVQGIMFHDNFGSKFVMLLFPFLRRAPEGCGGP